MSRRMKTAGIFVAIVVVTVVALVWTGLAHSGTSELENWIGRQLVGVLQSYVTPQIAFDDLSYEPPRGVTIQNLRFTAGDCRVLLIDRVSLELAEVPRTGQPVRISRVALDRPQVRLIADARGQLAGWSGFLRPDATRPASSAPKGQRFSDILVLRHVELHDGRVVYEPGSGSPAMTIAGIELALDTPPAAEAGWYSLIGTFRRAPLIEAAFDARINLDTALLEVKKLTIEGELGEKQYVTLPPPVQELLRSHQVQGALSATLSGSVPIADVSASTVEWEASLHKARFALNGTVLPVESVHTSGKYPHGPLSFAAKGVALGHQGQPLVSFREASAVIDRLPAKDDALRVDRLSVDGLRLSLAGSPATGVSGWASFPKVHGVAGPSLPTVRDLLRRLSIGALTLRDAGVSFQSRGFDRPIEIAGCDADMITSRSSDGRAIAIDLKISREPLIAAQLTCSIPFEATFIDVTRAQLDLDLSPNTQQGLPQALRGAIERQGLAGTLAVTAHGRIVPDDPLKSQIEAEAVANGIRVAIGASRAAVDRAKVAVSLPSGDIKATATRLSLRRGELTSCAANEASLDAVLGGDEAFVIRQLVLTAPKFELAQDLTGGTGGWSELGGGSSIATPTIQIRQIELHGADVTYRFADQTPPIVAEGIDLSVSLHPTDDPGAHAFTGTLSRKPLLDIAATGTYSAAGARLDLQQARLTADISEQTYATLPPRMRDTLQLYRLAGHIELSFHGHIPLKEPARTRGEARLDITNGAVAFRQTTWQAQDLHLKAGLPEGSVEVSVREVTALSATTRFFSLHQLQFELPAIPAPGRPFEIRRLQLDTPSVVLLRRSEGRLAGWSDLFPGRASGSSPVTTRPALNRLILLEDMRVRGGQVTYDRGDGSAPMSLPGIDLEIHMPSISEVPDRHALKATIRRDPVLSVSLEGKVSVDEAWLDLADCRLSVDLGDREYESLPPALQELLRKHEVRGDLDATFSGRVPLLDPLAMDTRFRVTLQNARLALRETVWPVQRFEASGTLASHRLDARYEASLLDGSARGVATCDLLDDQPFSLTWQVEQARIENTLRIIQQGEPQYSGRINSQGRLTGKARQLPETLSGRANLTISDAQLMRVPIIREILSHIPAARHGPKATDSASAITQFRPDRVRLSELNIASALVSLRGGGEVFYDGRLELTINADILERIGRGLDQVPLLNKDNPVKRITGLVDRLADRMVTYEVRGTVGQPQVRVKPLGLGR